MLASQLLGAGTPEGNLGQNSLAAVAQPCCHWQTGLRATYEAEVLSASRASKTVVSQPWRGSN
jgi:hypothetical protein